MRLSKTGLNTYLKCPFAFYLHYKLKIPFDKTLEMERGINFHEVANSLFDKITPDGLAQAESAEDYLLSFLPDEPLYKNFAHMQAIFYQGLDNKTEFFPIARELYIDVAEMTGKPTPIDVLDVGYIDWIGKHNEHLVLGEYKSGKFLPGIHQELMMYKVMYEAATGKKIDRICALYPMEIGREKLPSGVYYKSPSHEREARNKVQQVKEEIDAMLFDEKKRSYCSWCGVAAECANMDDTIEVKI
jgi:hypothetical protein